MSGARDKRDEERERDLLLLPPPILFSGAHALNIWHRLRSTFLGGSAKQPHPLLPPSPSKNGKVGVVATLLQSSSLVAVTLSADLLSAGAFLLKNLSVA